MAVIDIFGKQWKINCMGCSISNGEMNVPGGILFETEKFQLHQDPTNPIPGFLIISLKRHISSFASFTYNETIEFAKVFYEARKALGCIDGIEFCTLIQEEKAPHFHAWVLPHYNWMNNVSKGTLDSIPTMLTYAKQNWNTPEMISRVIEVASVLS
jgi:diadenosine tetraphosphate (Ap4A) HIT family hydrolase